MQEALFYEFSLERHVPADHLLRSIDRAIFLQLDGAALDRSRADDPDADHRLLLRHPLRSPAVRGGPSKPRLRWFCRLGLMAAWPVKEEAQHFRRRVRSSRIGAMNRAVGPKRTSPPNGI